MIIEGMQIETNKPKKTAITPTTPKLGAIKQDTNNESSVATAKG